MESFETERRALAALEKAREQAQDRLVSHAVRAWLRWQEDSGTKESTRKTNEYRLRGILRLAEGDRALRSVTLPVARGLYARRARARAGDTHLGELAVVTAMWSWCLEQGWVGDNPWLEVAGVGSKRVRPKDKLRVDEARRLVRCALAEGSKEGLAVVLAFYLGLRASEVTSRVVRDVDDRGRLLWVPCSKTPAGVRQVAIPARLREPLLALCSDRRPEELLWGTNSRNRPCDRHWLEHHCLRLCDKARVPRVRPHALRGLHATLAAVNGAAVEAVSRALGHAGKEVTSRHYLAPGTEEDLRARALEDRIG